MKLTLNRMTTLQLLREVKFELLTALTVVVFIIFAFGFNVFFL